MMTPGRVAAPSPAGSLPPALGLGLRLGLGLALLGGLGPGCASRDDPRDGPTPLPARILSDEGTTLQPVKLPELKPPEVEEVELVPPPGGDPKARAVVLGQAPVEQAIERREDGRVQVGRIVADPEEGTMLIPGRINQTSGIIEYMAVGPQGKLHESVLMLDVHPLHLQVASILLGLRPAPMPEQQDPAMKVVREGKTEADPAAPPSLAESQVTLEVSWLEDGKLVTRRAEDLAYNREQKKTMTRGPWIYTGSIISRGVLSAEFDQSYIATWPDRSALFNTPVITGNPYRGEGLGFEANFSLLPPKGTPIRMTLRRVLPQAPPAEGRAQGPEPAAATGGAPPGDLPAPGR